ncbi:MAG: metallophosphoesterase [Syntrophobacteraceae bacterium]|nr:metallophosphoesterase [Syntrophobacteraceae bacterium]
MKTAFRGACLSWMLAGLIALFSILSPCRPAWAGEKWSFAAFSDIHSAHASYQNVLNEIRSPTVAKEDRTELADFILVLGDWSPASINHGIFQRTFSQPRPLFLPVRGNHENAGDLRVMNSRILPAVASAPGASMSRLSRDGFSYWLDWKGVRLIVLDQYADFSRSAPSRQALQWLGQALESARAKDHVFVGFHEPILPWEAESDLAWRALLRNRSHIRAVFFGHTHVYFRTRLPEFLGGTHLVNVGNGGQRTHSDLHQTIVSVSIDGDSARGVTLQAADGQSEFRAIDAFDMSGY